MLQVYTVYNCKVLCIIYLLPTQLAIYHLRNLLLSPWTANVSCYSHVEASTVLPFLKQLLRLLKKVSGKCTIQVSSRRQPIGDSPVHPELHQLMIRFLEGDDMKVYMILHHFPEVLLTHDSNSPTFAQRVRVIRGIV